MASWLLRLLKTTDYIPTEFKTPSSPDAKLSAEELFLADLLFHNLQLLQFNSHEVTTIIICHKTLHSVFLYLKKYLLDDQIERI